MSPNKEKNSTMPKRCKEPHARLAPKSESTPRTNGNKIIPIVTTAKATAKSGRDRSQLISQAKTRKSDLREVLLRRFEYARASCDDADLATRLESFISDLQGRPPEIE